MILVEETRDKTKGGLYRNVRMSVKTANLLVLIGIAVFAAVFVFVVSNNGFTVSFDSMGGTEVESIRAMHGDMLTVTEIPTKEGYVFTGWYRDKACTYKWNEQTDTVTDSMTLYAGWEEKSAP